MRREILTRIEIACILLVFLGLGSISCSTLKERPQDSPTVRDVGTGKYYQFDDVLIPRELNYVPDESFVYETTQLKTGSMTFKKWRADRVALADYFLDHMEKDNWKLVNRFQGKETILNFRKPEKTCTIKVVGRWYGTTVVEVRVGPLEIKM